VFGSHCVDGIVVLVLAFCLPVLVSFWIVAGARLSVPRLLNLVFSAVIGCAGIACLVMRALVIRSMLAAIYASFSASDESPFAHTGTRKFETQFSEFIATSFDC